MTSSGPLYDIDAQWHVVFLTTHLAWAVSEVGFLRLGHGRAAIAARRPWLLLMVPASLVASLFITEAYPDGRILAPPVALLAASLVLTWLGMGIRVWSLHDQASPGRSAQSQSDAVGLHRWNRYPAYTGAFITLVGIALGYGNALSLSVVTAATTIFFGRQMQPPPSPGESGPDPSRRWQILPFIW